jgi:hypothetical protein
MPKKTKAKKTKAKKTKADPYDFPFGFNVAPKPKKRKPPGGGS